MAVHAFPAPAPRCSALLEPLRGHDQALTARLIAAARVTNPTRRTVWYQITPSGNVNIFGARLSVNRAIGQHIVEQVLPFQEKYRLYPKRSTYERGKAKGYTFRDIGDPAGVKGNEQTKTEETAVWVIESLLKTAFEPGPVAWSARRQALKIAFYRPGTGDRSSNRPTLETADR